MKINPIAILIIVVFLASCGMSDKRLIAEAENLVEEHPDSALEVLNGVESVDRLSNEWTARYWIATAMAHSGNGESLSEDSLIVFALDYYENNHPVDSAMLLKARTAAASYYWWKEQPAKAKAVMLKTLEERKKTGDKKEMRKILYSLAELAFRIHNLKDATYYTEELIKLDGGDFGHTDLLDGLAMGSFYHGNKEQSFAYSERAIAHIDTAPDSVFAWMHSLPNYADVLIDCGQLDKGIAIYERVLKHYRQCGDYYQEQVDVPIFSLSHAWLLKGDKQKAKYYMDMLPKNTFDDYHYNEFRFCMIGHKMVLDYALTGKYNITDMSEYVNGVGKRFDKNNSVAEAKERAIHKLHEHQLHLQISRQQQLIFFLLLTIGLIIIIISMSTFLRRRKRLIKEMEEETRMLNKQLGKLQKEIEQKTADTEAQEEVSPCQSTIVLTGGTSETITLYLPDVLYIETVGNYVKVHQIKDGKVCNDMLRATLKQVMEQLSSCTMIVRCHRAFLVNLQQVDHISSKGGATQLFIKHCHETLPVSRSNMAQVKAAIKRS